VKKIKKKLVVIVQGKLFVFSFITGGGMNEINEYRSEQHGGWSVA
jgi:hypothetical protein